MKAVFLESAVFTEWVTTYLSDEALAQLQLELMDDPARGTVIPGCGGLRKIRAADPSRGLGKRSGIRVIYLYVPEARWFFLLSIYEKGRKDDLSAQEKRELTALVTKLQRQARASLSMREKS